MSLWPPPSVDRFARLRCVLLLRGDNVEAISARIGIAPAFLRLVMHGRVEPSPAILGLLFVELGSDAWRFVLGETSILDAPQLEVAP